MLIFVKGSENMLKKEEVINVLEDIDRCLYDDDWKRLTLSSIKQYKKRNNG